MKVLKCDLCSFTAPTSARVKLHKLSVHSDLRPWPCSFPGCNYAAKLKGELTRHSTLHELEPELRNPLLSTFEDCDYRTNPQSQLNRHVKRRHTPSRTIETFLVCCTLPHSTWNQIWRDTFEVTWEKNRLNAIFANTKPMRPHSFENTCKVCTWSCLLSVVPHLNATTTRIGKATLIGMLGTTIRIRLFSFRFLVLFHAVSTA